MIKYRGMLIAVEDIPAARRFYETVLGQKVTLDFGVNVGFEGGLAIHQKAHFQSLLGDPERFPVTLRAHAGELYFETEEIDRCEQRLNEERANFLHPILEQPWGQRVLRVYDPDGYVVEIGETMEMVVQRMHGQGMSVDAIQAKTGMPRSFVEAVLTASSN